MEFALSDASSEISGAGTNLKVGVPDKFVSRDPLFYGFISTISGCDERFRDGQYNLVSFLSAVLLLTVPPCPAICKSGGTCPRAVYESAPLTEVKQTTKYF